MRTIELEIPREEVEREKKRILKAFQQKVKVDGFRKGKVPENIVLQMHGKDIRAEAIEEVLPKAFSKVLEEHDISPLAPPLVDDLDYGETGPMTVRATVEVMPEFEVKGYRGLKLEKAVREVTGEDVEESLEGLLERTAELVPVERPAEFGDYLIADIVRCDDAGTPIIGERSENRTLFVAEEGDGSDVGRQLVGVEKGGDRRVAVERSAAGQGAPATVSPGSAQRQVFLVQVKEVKEKHLPTLDDEYAKALGDFEDLADMRSRIREDLENHVDSEARRMMVGQAVDALIKKNSVDVPESMIQRYLEGVIQDHKQAAGDQPVDEEGIRQQYRGIAQVQMKWQMLQARIAEQEEIEVSDDEVRERVNRFAENYSMDPDEAYRAFTAQGRLNRIRAEIREEKVVELIIDSAKVKEKKVSPKKEPEAAGEEKVAPVPSREESMLVGQGGAPEGAGETPGPETGPDEEPDMGGSGLIIPGR